MIPATSLAGAGSALSRAQGKDIRWDARGIDTELDRGVLHQLADSLLHLVRNAVDHGVEPMAEREAAGKQRQGTIRLHAMQLGSEVIVAITDDGNGIDLDEILVVIEKNLRPLSFTPGMRRDPRHLMTHLSPTPSPLLSTAKRAPPSFIGSSCEQWPLLHTPSAC